jgi:acetyl-CoA C-acetyltransferase
MSIDAVVIVNGARTPMGGFQGALSALPLPNWAPLSFAKPFNVLALHRLTYKKSSWAACCLPASSKARPRQATLDAGLPAATGCTTINKLCGCGHEGHHAGA